jgi:hypothetical protein
MSNAKAQALDVVRGLPDDCTWEQIVERIALKAQLELGMAEIDAGKGIPHEQLKQEMREWLRSSGPTRPAAISTTPSHPSVAIPS